MDKRCVLLTGKIAGDWYLKTLNGLLKENNVEVSAYDAIQIDFQPINAILPNRMKDAARLLEPYFVELEKREEPYILANITLHEAVEHFSFSPEYFISIEDILRRETENIKSKLAILGTKHTMEHSFVSSMLPYKSIVSLPETIQDRVDDLRRHYYTNNNPIFANDVFRELGQLHVDYYIIACTELAVALSDVNPDIQVINIPELQCQYLLNPLCRKNFRNACKKGDKSAL